jgi:hypothetical protein
MQGLAQSLADSQMTAAELLLDAGGVNASVAAVSGSAGKLSAVTEELRSLGHRFTL